MSATNPIKEWLARVAAECGDPDAMIEQAKSLKNENTRRLIIEYAQYWKRKLALRRPA